MADTTSLPWISKAGKPRRMEDTQLPGLYPHAELITRAARDKRLNQQSFVLWFTGLSGSGKSTVAASVEQQLFEHNKIAYRLDGDNIRGGINRDLGFCRADRQENIRRIAEISKLLADAGLIVLNSFISPYQQDRDHARHLHESAGFRFLEIYIDCPLAIAEQRDPKGLYKKARAGEILQFTGVDSPYEPPLKPDLHLDSANTPVTVQTTQILNRLKTLRLIC